MNGKPLSREPNKVLMYQKHMPYSKGPTFTLADEQICTWWSSDGKRPMLDIVHLLSIVNKHTESAAKEVWRKTQKKMSKIGKECKFITIDEGYYGKNIMEIAYILELFENKCVGYTLKFKREYADPFRDTIIATLKAIDAAASAPSLSMEATNAQDAMSPADSIAHETPNTVMHDTESDSD